MPFDSASDTSRRGAIWLPNWLPFGVEDARNLLSVRFVAIYTGGFESRLSLSLEIPRNPKISAIVSGHHMDDYSNSYPNTLSYRITSSRHSYAHTT